jgi:hypothetical protein
MKTKRRTGVVNQAELEPVANYRDPRSTQQSRLGNDFGDQIEHHRNQGRDKEQSAGSAGSIHFSGACHLPLSLCM